MPTVENFKTNKIVVYDTETTCLKAKRIVSIAFICYENGKRVGAGYRVCNPNYPIAPQASEVNGFTNEAVKKEPLFPVIWGEIHQYFEDAYWIGHNVDFDRKALLGEFERYEIEVPNYATIDTCKIARKYIKGLPNYKLNTLCDYFNITLDHHHDARDDVVACKGIYNELVKLSKGDIDVVYYKGVRKSNPF